MKSFVSYPEHMQQEARDLIAATRANPGREAAEAIDEFIDRSPEHESCFQWEVDLQRYQRQSFRIKHDPPKRSVIAPVLFMLIAVSGIAVVAVRIPGAPPQPAIVRTEASAKAHVLADGSQVLLFPNSGMRANVSSPSRRIELLAGGFMIQPKNDASRPFEVVAGNTRIIPLGTRFTVLLRPEDREVVLTEGKLRVLATNGGSVDLAPGEFTTVSDQGAISAPAPKLAARPQAEPESRVGTISEIASAFNRQNSTIQIEVSGERGRRYEFTLQLDNPDEWLKELAHKPFIQVTRETGLITIVKIIVIG